MKKILIITCLVLSGCMSMKDTRQPANKTVYELNVGYQEAYRMITTSLMHECGLVSGSIQPIIYTDVGYATINHVIEGNVAWSIDLKSEGPGKASMDFYSGYKAQQKFAARIARHVNEKIPECYFDAIN